MGETTGTKSRILPTPLGPALSRTCDTCQRRWALRLQKSRRDNLVEKVYVYRCKFCEAEFEYAKRLPWWVV